MADPVTLVPAAGSLAAVVPVRNLLAFVEHFLASGLAFAVFLWAYVRFTPWDDLKLIREGDTAAAAGLVGAMFGFVTPVGAVVMSSHSVIETAAWSVIALAVQMLVLCGLRLVFRNLAVQIVGGNLAEGILLGGLSAAAGVLEAACLYG
jgi:putative membrane protein